MVRNSTPRGANHMKRLIIFCLVFALSSVSLPVANSASTASAVEAKILLLKEKISQQVEKVRYSREQADGQMALARIRVANQLSQAEENLLLQIEVLDRFREQLRDQVTETNAAIEQLKTDRVLVLDKAIMDVEEQVRQTNDLIEQTRILKESFEKESSVKQNEPVLSGPTASSSATPQEPAQVTDSTATGTSSFQPEFFFPVQPATAPPLSPTGSGCPFMQ